MTAHRTCRERVIAVITAFAPEPTLAEHCATIAQQVASVIVVDDGSGSQSEPLLQQLEQAGHQVLRQPNNLGIAAAINRGTAAAIAQGAELVATFDQDSQISAGFIEALVREYDRGVEAGHSVGMVAPEFFSNTPQTRTRQPGEALEAYAPIQSGLLMPASAIRRLGAQREEYFIDLVDTEYYVRARTAGYEARCVPGLVLAHGFGQLLTVHLWGRQLRKRDGRPRLVAVSTPFRYYYRARNRIVVHRAYARHAQLPPQLRRLLRRDAIRDLLLDYGVAVWSARGKLALLSLICAGWRDGWRGRMGKIPARLARRAASITWKHPR